MMGRYGRSRSFAKAPVPGKVRTRLIPLLGVEGAARPHSDVLLIGTDCPALTAVLIGLRRPAIRSRYRTSTRYVELG
jgi:glycosyltransferase A (GT-A) superfamily protein (DUF2064 family)